MTHDARARIVDEHPFDLLRRERGAVGDDDLAGVDGAPDANAATVMNRDPGCTGCGVEQCVEQRPVSDRVGTVGHRFGLAVGGGD